MWVWRTRPTNAVVKPIPSSVSDMSNVAGVLKGDVHHSRYGGSETIFCKMFFRKTTWDALDTPLISGDQGMTSEGT